MDSRKMTHEEFTRGVEELLFPLGDTDQISFEDLFDLEDIQKLQDDFAKATNVASLITGPDGIPITRPSGFTRLCEDIIRKSEKGLANCYDSDKEIGQLNENGATVKKCKSCGLWDGGARISVGGRHIANWLIGQVRDENVPETEVLEYADEIGVDKEEMLAAYRQVPVMSNEQFQHVANMLYSLARQISKTAHQQLLQIQYIEQYRQLHDVLRESEETLRRITSSAQDAIVMMDERGQVTFWNEAAETIFGYNSDEIIGRNLHSCLAPQKFEKRYQTALASFKETGEGRNLNKTQELTALKKNGQSFPIELSLSSVDVRGKKHAIGIIRDITSRKAAEAAEREMAETLKHSQKMAAIGTLAGGIAHDFNNILSAILGFTELLELQAEPGSKSEKYLHNISDAGMRAKKLIKQILAFSRQVKKDVQPVLVRSIVQEVVNLLRPSVPTNIEIQENAASEAMVLGDPSQIHQIVMNLCTNAFHAMRSDGGVLRVELTEKEHDPDISGELLSLPAGRYVQLVVSDTGHGIAGSVIDQIFDPFFTTKEPGEGTGMGLSVVHGIVNSCNGTIYVKSEEGGGTSFIVLLPEVEARSLPKKDSPDVPDRGSEKIMVIDDENAIVEILRQMLGSLGYNVTATTNPYEALEMFSAHPDQFDLIVSDLTMPQLTGDRLAKEMLAVRSDIPVVVCTGFNSALTEDRAREIGIRKVLLKPVTRKQMTQAIREVLDEKDHGEGATP